MNKKNGKNMKLKSKKLVFIMSGILVILILVAAIIFRQRGQNEDTDESIKQEKTEVQSVEFPYLIEDENLEVTSMFSYTGFNPDAKMQEVSEIAAIDFKNVSDKFLEHATVKAMFSDGSEQTFVIENLPAGKGTLAFCVDNQELLTNESCVDITVETVFEEDIQDDCIEVSIEGTIITVENIAEEDLTGIDVYYRDVYDDKYFGGKTHKYTIETLPKGESATITVEESIWGVIGVVRVEVNK